MSTISEIKDAVNTKTTNLFLLTVVTGGIYPALWLYKNNSIIESMTKKITGDNFIILLAACLGLGGTLAGTGVEAIDIVALILTMSSWALYTVWAFKAKAALQEYALNEHQEYKKNKPLFHHSQ